MINSEQMAFQAVINILASVEANLQRNVVELSLTKVKEENMLNMAINTKHVSGLMKIENDIMR